MKVHIQPKVSVQVQVQVQSSPSLPHRIFPALMPCIHMPCHAAQLVQENITSAVEGGKVANHPICCSAECPAFQRAQLTIA